MQKLIFIDDYSEENYRIASLIKSYNLEKNTIFFIDFRDGNTIEQIKYFKQLGFGFGSHTVTHSFLNEVSLNQLIFELEESKKAIEKVIRKGIEWLCPPRGRYDDKVIKYAKLYGYKYIRSTKIFDTKNITEGINHTTIHAGCPVRPEYQGKNWVNICNDYIEKCKQDNSLFKLWFHAFELSKYGEWDNLEKVLKNLTKW